MPPDERDEERDRLTGRIARVAQVGAGLSGAAAAFGVNQLLGGEGADPRAARALAAALGGVKGPLMKVAQMLATVPDLLPADYATELARLQTNAPAMGASFVRRRMKAELGPDWRTRFSAFDETAAHAASLGQVHRATGPDGRALACKLQYPDMASAVEADLAQLAVILGLVRRMSRIVDPSEIGVEVGERLREELDYAREAKAMTLFAAMLADVEGVRAPTPVPALSTPRLLTMTWLEGRPILAYKEAAQEVRNRLAERLFNAWWRPMCRYGVIHGDPHPGNYAAAEDGAALNLLDFGCIRIFPASFMAGVVALYRALQAGDRAGEAAAYEGWGFTGLTAAQIEALSTWARFIYGPLLEDRVRSVADGVSPAAYGRREAWRVKEMLQEHGPVRIPRAFVFMDRAAIGLGAAFLHLRAELNFHRLFEASLERFDEAALAQRQSAALEAAGLAR